MNNKDVDLNIKKSFLVIKKLFRDVAFNPLHSKNEVKDWNSKEQSNIATNTAQQAGKLANLVLFPKKE